MGQALWAKCKCSSSVSSHSWWGLICCSKAVRKCSHCTLSLPKRQYMEEVQAHDSFIFFRECSFSTLFVWRPELFILHKERNAKGYKDNQNGESSAWDTQTHPHTFTCQTLPPTHTHAAQFEYGCIQWSWMPEKVSSLTCWEIALLFYIWSAELSELTVERDLRDGRKRARGRKREQGGVRFSLEERD